MNVASTLKVPCPSDELDLVRLAIRLGARTIGQLSAVEESLAERAAQSFPADVDVEDVRELIRCGEDPLGDFFCTLRTPAERRIMGATYTPNEIVEAMVGWAADHGAANRIVDPGVGSGRFLWAAARQFPAASLIGIEVDPLAAILCRANAAVLGLQDRVEVLVADYRSVVLPPIVGRTAFIGNPPYVRHHQIDAGWKTWLSARAKSLGLHASQLAGLHLHFFLATVGHARPLDFGAFVTSAEWLDVNYGELLRQLFLGELGGRSIDVVSPTAQPFPDATTTAAVTCFTVGTRHPSIRLRQVEQTSDLFPMEQGSWIRRERLEVTKRWTPLLRTARPRPQGWVELGELCRVHRGQVTGQNDVWVTTEQASLPKCVQYPSITRARELFQSGRALTDASFLKRVIDIPVDLDVLSGDERRMVELFLLTARSRGADQSYVARARRAWWSVGLREPAPILATYMARRPPAFVRNVANARHINIAHGLYPREPLTDRMLCSLVEHLSTSVSTQDGRVYAGGLTKFEPREMERLLVPEPHLLEQQPIRGVDS